MPRKERILQTKILRDLCSLGRFCVAFDIIKCGEDGVPDIFFTTENTGAIFIEAKDPDGVLSKKQEDMVANLKSCGVKAAVIWSWQEWVEFKRRIGLG